MPRATVSTEPERHELESCPEGFVVIKRMPYGKYLERQALSMEVKMQMEKGKSTGMDIAMTQKRVALFEFQNCIVEHNLTDENDELLNFRSPQGLDALDPKIGNEIGDLIDALHNFETGAAGN